MENEFGGVSAIGHMLAIILVGGIAAVLGVVVDKGNNIFFTGLSADAANTIYSLEMAFLAAPLLYIIAVIISHWINEKSMANQGV